ncbi:hypothetical protein [Flavobacterium soli]|uniref:hypothetical protein n=1 Tax=Flavobacterium soli TaxID=344881 RepID=UPI0003F97B63|nr:hypothetical protein [Flavobacterium soli]
MVDLCFFQAWLKKNFVHQKFDIEPVVLTTDLIASQDRIYFGTLSDAGSNCSYNGNIIHTEYDNKVLFDRVVAGSDQTQFIGYVANPLPS